MQDMIQFLINNLDVLIKVKEGTASLIGVSPEELKAILEVFSDYQKAPKAYYWM
jgi:competence protein ComX